MSRFVWFSGCLQKKSSKNKKREPGEIKAVSLIAFVVCHFPQKKMSGRSRNALDGFLADVRSVKRIGSCEIS